MTFEFLSKKVKISQPFQCFHYFKVIRNNKTILCLEYDKIRILLLILYFNETFTYVSSYFELISSNLHYMRSMLIFRYILSGNIYIYFKEFFLYFFLNSVPASHIKPYARKYNH